MLRTIQASMMLALLFAIHSAPSEAQEALRRLRTRPAAGLSAAVSVSGRSLLHTTQLFPSVGRGEAGDNGLQQQFETLTNRLEDVLRHAGSDRPDVVKLNVYVTDVDAADFVRAHLREWFGDRDLPAVSYVQTRLPVPGTRIALDAVVSSTPLSGARPRQARLEAAGTSGSASSYSVMPLGDAIYIAGQAQPGELPAATAQTLNGLLRTLEYLNLSREQIVQLKCFLAPMADVASVDRQIAAFFGDRPIPPVSHVEWISGRLPIEIELVACAPAAASADTIEIGTPPWMKASPVFSRVTRLFGDERIYLSGMYARQTGDAESQVRDIFAAMRAILAEAGSDFRHLAKATYYVSTAEASSQLGAIRPTVYDPSRPPAASKATVAGVGAKERSIAMEMIASRDPTVDLPTPDVAVHVVEDSSVGDFQE